MKVTLKEILADATNSDYAIAGFNIFSIDWAKAVISAAESERQALILMCNRSMIEHLPPQYSGYILSDLAEKSSVPVCVHLDHNSDYTIIQSAIDSGFSSVMYDGSHLSLEENIANSKEVRKMTDKKGISLEGEVGTVRYLDMPDTQTEFTAVEDAKRYAEETKIDALAVSVGTTHRMTERGVGVHIQYDRIQEIEQAVEQALVIHGTSGILEEDLVRMKQHRIAKFNIGTLLRQAFAKALRETLSTDKDIFDWFDMSKSAYEAVGEEAAYMMRLIGRQLN